MKDIQVIVIPVDFLEHTGQIAEYARYIGNRLHAQLKFIHVVELPNNWGDSDYPSLTLFPNEVEIHVRNQMKEFITQQKRDYPQCEGKVALGDPSEVIVKYAEEVNADLIIMGTHGRKGLTRFWLGSVAERVVKQAKCPTLTCNPYN